jgi:hypothetical protein
MSLNWYGCIDGEFICMFEAYTASPEEQELFYAFAGHLAAKHEVILGEGRTELMPGGSEGAIGHYDLRAPVKSGPTYLGPFKLLTLN